MAVIISSGLVVSSSANTPPFALTHARIGYLTHATASNVTASSEAAGFPASSAVTPLTYDQWRPETLPAWWKFNNGSAIDSDYIGIAGHNLSDVGAVVTIESSADDSTWSTLSEFSPGDNNPIMLIFDTVKAQYWRVSLTVVSGTPFIGTIYIGEALAMQRRIYGGHTPITLARETVTIPTVSDAGQFLGRSTVRKGVSTTFSWKNLTASWYRQYFDPFAKVARENAFFIAWRPADYPNEVGFCWTANDIRPANMGVKDFMSVDLSVSGLGD